MSIFLTPTETRVKAQGLYPPLKAGATVNARLYPAPPVRPTPEMADTTSFGAFPSLGATSQAQLRAFFQHPNTRLGGGILLKFGVPLLLAATFPFRWGLPGIVTSLLCVGIAQKTGNLARATLHGLESSHFKDRLGKRLFAVAKEDLTQLFGNPANAQAQARLGLTKYQYLLANINLMTKRLVNALPVPPELTRVLRAVTQQVAIAPEVIQLAGYIPLVGKKLANTLAGYNGFRDRVLGTSDEALIQATKRGVYKRFLQLSDKKWSTGWLIRQTLDTGFSQSKSILEATNAKSLRAAYGNWWQNTRTDIRAIITARSMEKVIEVVARKLPPFIGTPLIWGGRILDRLIEWFARPK